MSLRTNIRLHKQAEVSFKAEMKGNLNGLHSL